MTVSAVSSADFFDPAAPHIPVLLREVLGALAPKDGEVMVDGTFGAGGYARKILAAANCRLYAIDRDPAALETAHAMAADFEGRLIPLAGCFGDVADLLATNDVQAIDGLVLDLGVSSMQLDQPERGFSFRHDGPLDMRMGQTGESAADVVNTASEQQLADIIFTYGEERAARRIARRIVEARATAAINTTRQLVTIVHSVLPMHGGIKTDTATRTFQALRIYVNDELGELERALDAALGLLKPGGRLAVVSFHSLEDGIVKQFLRRHSGRVSAPSRHMPHAPAAEAAALLTVDKNSGWTAQEDELAINPRARSARLRVGVRTTAPLPAEGFAHA